MTQLHVRKLVTVVCETSLERRVLQSLREAGASGYTMTDVRGGGARGERGGDWEGGRSVEVKVLCDEGTAQRLVDALIARYSADYALALWVVDAAVARPAKFT
jgi:nitrogen regulatory protein PII